MTKLTGIRACVFDAYGTLFDVHSPVGRLADKLGDKADAVSRMWRDKQLQYTWLRSLMPAHADFWQVTGEALDFSLRANGIENAALREDLMQAYLSLDVYPDVDPLLTSLKSKGVQTAILSNGSRSMLDSAIASSGIGPHLDMAISIDDVGVFKPDPKVYQLAVDQTNVDAANICFVSTNGWDASGAAHFGFQVVWMNRFGMHQENLPGDYRTTISGLDELPALVL